MGGFLGKMVDGAVTVATDINHSVTEVVVSTTDSIAIFSIDTERNVFQSYMDTQANVAVLLNNYGANITNVIESTQRNVTNVAMDSETRFFSVVDSLFDRITDIITAVADGFFFLAILWIVSIGGFWLLYNKEIFAILKGIIDKVPISMLI